MEKGYIDLHLRLSRPRETPFREWGWSRGALMTTMGGGDGLSSAPSEQRTSDAVGRRKGEGGSVENTGPPPLGQPGLVRGTEIVPSTRGQLKETLARMGGRAGVLAVRCGPVEVTRAAAEDSRVDFLSSPGPLDHIVVRSARENHVAIEFPLHTLIHTRGTGRSNYLKAMGRNLMLARKYGAATLLTTQAREPLDLRAPRDAEAMGQVLGMSPEEARRSLTETPAAILQRRGL
ncbi:MAG: hypothetical protein HY558_00845 [Euryarchaeota archaeon]|nr:hypothetical protein [Euryarchaeota archaeon]